MSVRDLNSIGFVIFLGGLIVALLGPIFSSRGHSGEKVVAFNWYVLGALAMGVGVCIMIR